MLKRLPLFCASILLSCVIAGFLNVSPVKAYGCNFSSINAQASTPFTVSVSNARDAGDVNTIGRTSPVTATLIVWKRGDHSFRNSVAITINNGVGSAQLTAPFSPGTEIEVELKVNNEADSVCISSPATLGTNQSLLPDGSSSGCCSSTSQCVAWYGGQSTCPNGSGSNGNNGSCQSGYQCVGGDPNFLVQPGQSCSAIPAGQEYSRCATHVCIAGICAQPCGNNLSCLQTRYPNPSQACDPNSCDCNSVLSSYEQPITNGSSGALPNSLCGIGVNSACITYAQGNIGNALYCHPEKNSACTDIHCGLSADVANRSVTIDVACLPESNYQLSLFLGNSADSTDQIPFSVDVNHTNKTLQASGFSQIPAGYSEVVLRVNDSSDPGNYLCSLPLSVDMFDVAPPGTTPAPGALEEFKVCAQTGTPGSPERAACQSCFDSEGIWTAVGCIPYKNTAGLVRAFIILGLGISGGVVILMILAGAFLMSTSQGEPQRVDEAKSLITSAIAGIFFLIFSVSILQFIGVRILQIPGFG